LKPFGATFYKAEAKEIPIRGSTGCVAADGLPARLSLIRELVDQPISGREQRQYKSAKTSVLLPGAGS